jgi:hypothetical protein
MSVRRALRAPNFSANRHTAFTGDGDTEGMVDLIDDGFGGRHDISDVFVCQHPAPQNDQSPEVTLFVVGWNGVAPGPLSWRFPSMHTALEAVRTMKNAIEWCIVAGSDWASLDAARAGDAVLIEQTG